MAKGKGDVSLGLRSDQSSGLSTAAHPNTSEGRLPRIHQRQPPCRFLNPGTVRGLPAASSQFPREAAWVPAPASAGTLGTAIPTATPRPFSTLCHPTRRPRRLKGTGAKAHLCLLPDRGHAGAESPRGPRRATPNLWVLAAGSTPHTLKPCSQPGPAAWEPVRAPETQTVPCRPLVDSCSHSASPRLLLSLAPQPPGLQWPGAPGRRDFPFLQALQKQEGLHRVASFSPKVFQSPEANLPPPAPASGRMACFRFPGIHAWRPLGREAWTLEPKDVFPPLSNLYSFIPTGRPAFLLSCFFLSLSLSIFLSFPPFLLSFFLSFSTDLT